MKKSLLVAALIAGFAGVANAETSVTLYGRIDTGIGYQQFKGTDADGVGFKGRKTGLVDGIMGGNRWGLKGTEDLGNGLQAVFVLENGFNLSDGTSSDMFDRQATLGLKSSAWGQLDFGRQTTVSSKYLVGVASPFGSPDWGQASVGSAFSAINNVRYDNMIMYQTPKFSGFQLGMNYSFTGDRGAQQFKQSGGQEPNDTAWGVAARYGNGPLNLGLSYDQYTTAELPSISGDRDTSIKAWNLAGSFDFEVVEVHAAFGQTRNGWFKHVSALDSRDVGGARLSWVADEGAKVNSYTVGLSAPLGANGKLMGAWVMADPKGGFGGRDEKQNVYSLGYTYKLSKRTNVYALGSYGKGLGFYDDLKGTQFAVGMRHQF